MVAMENELKYCPFCRSSRVEVRIETALNGKYVYFVMCLDCIANGPIAQNENLAAERWNDGESKTP